MAEKSLSYVSELEGDRIVVYMPIPNNSRIPLFQVEIQDGLLLIHNSDAGFYPWSKVYQISHERPLKPNDESQMFEKFFEDFFGEVSSVKVLWEDYLESFYEKVFKRKMLDQGYKIEKVVRGYKPSFEGSLLLFLNDSRNRKVLDVFIYNIDSYSIGIQAVSKIKIHEIKIQKRADFTKLLQDTNTELSLIFPRVSNMDVQMVDSIFGLSWDTIKQHLLHEITENCRAFIYSELADKLSKLGDSFSADLTQVPACDLGKTKIYANNLSLNYIQYVELIFDNEYFTNSFMVSSQEDVFQKDVKTSFLQFLTELQKIKVLRTQPSATGIDYFNNTVKFLSEANSHLKQPMKCTTSEKVFTCSRQSQTLVVVQEKVYQDKQYINVQFMNNSLEHLQGTKLLDEVKVPVDSGSDFTQRIEERIKANFQNY